MEHPLLKWAISGRRTEGNSLWRNASSERRRQIRTIMHLLSQPRSSISFSRRRHFSQDHYVSWSFSFKYHPTVQEHFQEAPVFCHRPCWPIQFPLAFLFASTTLEKNMSGQNLLHSCSFPLAVGRVQDSWLTNFVFVADQIGFFDMF